LWILVYMTGIFKVSYRKSATPLSYTYHQHRGSLKGRIRSIAVSWAMVQKNGTERLCCDRVNRKLSRVSSGFMKMSSVRHFMEFMK
jgi:hypothetical protein